MKRESGTFTVLNTRISKREKRRSKTTDKKETTGFARRRERWLARARGRGGGAADVGGVEEAGQATAEKDGVCPEHCYRVTSSSGWRGD